MKLRNTVKRDLRGLLWDYARRLIVFGQLQPIQIWSSLTMRHSWMNSTKNGGASNQLQNRCHKVNCQERRFKICLDRFLCQHVVFFGENCPLIPTEINQTCWYLSGRMGSHQNYQSAFDEEVKRDLVIPPWMGSKDCVGSGVKPPKPQEGLSRWKINMKVTFCTKVVVFPV